VGAAAAAPAAAVTADCRGWSGLPRCGPCAGRAMLCSMLRSLFVVLSLSPVVVAAGDSGFSGSVAIASTGIDRPYAGTRTDHSLAPLVLGQWRNVYFEGNRVSVGLHQGEGWSLAALAQLRLHQYTDDRDR